MAARRARSEAVMARVFAEGLAMRAKSVKTAVQARGISVIAPKQARLMHIAITGRGPGCEALPIQIRQAMPAANRVRMSRSSSGRRRAGVGIAGAGDGVGRFMGGGRRDRRRYRGR